MFKTREYIYSLSIYLSSNAELNGKLERFKCFIYNYFAIRIKITSMKINSFSLKIKLISQPRIFVRIFYFFFFSFGGDSWPGEVSHADAFQLTTRYHVRPPRFPTPTLYTRHCEICVPYGTFTGCRVLKTFQKWK